MARAATTLSYIESAKDLFEIAAIVVGAFWTYMNYVRAGDSPARAEMSVICNKGDFSPSRPWFLTGRSGAGR